LKEHVVHGEKLFRHRPRSFRKAGFGMRNWPVSATRSISLMLCVIRGRACRPESICACTTGRQIKWRGQQGRSDPICEPWVPVLMREFAPNDCQERHPRRKKSGLARQRGDRVDGRASLPENSWRDMLSVPLGKVKKGPTDGVKLISELRVKSNVPRDSFRPAATRGLGYSVVPRRSSVRLKSDMWRYPSPPPNVDEYQNKELMKFAFL